MKTELISPIYYQFEDLRFELSQVLDQELSPRTLRYWLKQIGIVKDSSGFYHHSDLELLKAWALTRDTFKSFENFNNWRKEHYAPSRRPS